MARSLAPSRPSSGAGSRDDALVDVLQEVSRRLVGLTASALAKAEVAEGREVSLAQYRVLVVLTRGPATPTALADDLGVSRPAIARMLGNLRGRGLVDRSRDERDGRQAWIAITPAGASIVDAVVRERAKELRRVARALSSPQRAALQHSLLRMLDALSAPATTERRPTLAV